MSDQETTPEPEATESGAPESGNQESAPPPPPPSGPSSDSSGDGSNKGLMLVLAYFGIFAVIPLLVEKDDPEVQWHAKNGLVWSGAWVALWILFSMLGFLTGGASCIFAPVIFLLGVAIMGLHIAAMIKATKGERLRLPVLSDFADKF